MMAKNLEEAGFIGFLPEPDNFEDDTLESIVDLFNAAEREFIGTEAYEVSPGLSVRVALELSFY